MDAPLLERDAELAVITEALDRACGGTGSVVLLSGEAGIGKTSVVRAFLRSVGEQEESCTAPVTTSSPPARWARFGTPPGPVPASWPPR